MSDSGFDVDYFIGCVSSAAPDALSFMAPPQVPANYKKPEVIAEFKEKKREEFVEKAAFQGVTGQLTAVHVESLQGRVVLSVTCNDSTPGAVSVPLIQFLCKVEEYPVTVGSSFTPRVRLWGFSLDQMFRIAGLEALRYGAEYGMPDPPPLRCWYKNNCTHDPFDILTGGAERRLIGLEGLCRYLGMGLNPAEIDPTQSKIAHGNLARVARNLCVRTGLVFYQG